MDKKELYTKARKIIGDRTPLGTDCGILCEKSCCSGNDSTGMMLFPGEETPLRIIEGEAGRIAVCDGTCDRNSRPLSCMLFPFFPVSDGKGGITVSPDYRGYSVCLLIRNFEMVRFDRKFLKSVEKAGRLLYTDGDCRTFIDGISEVIDEELQLINKFK